MTVIYSSVMGSRLFGCYNENSDWDYKSVHIPTDRQIILGQGNNVSDSKGEEDKQSFPLKKYLNLLTKMELNSVELLFSTASKTSRFELHPVWKTLWDNKFKILSKDKKPFVGFAKSQAMRYAVRGDRYDTLSTVVEYLQDIGCPQDKMTKVWSCIQDDLTKLKGVEIIQAETEYLSVFGRKVPMGSRLQEAIDIYLKPLKEAGERTRVASGEGGVDWKGLYHAHRVVDEGLELWETGRIVFPLKNCGLYSSIRNQEFTLDKVIKTFMEKLDKLEALDDTKYLNDTPDTQWAEDFLYDVYFREVTKGKLLNQ